MSEHDAMQSSTILRHPALPILQDSEGLSLLCKAAGDNLRLTILRILRTESLGVLEMSRILAVKQSALSHHLKVLANAGLVSTRREINTIFYRRVIIGNDDPLASLKTAIFTTVDQIRLDRDLAGRLHEIKQERDQQSLDFFAKFADRFKQNQDLVAESRQYAGTLLDLLYGLDLPQQSSVLEVGPGVGELLPVLAREFSQVIALDNSAEMLNQAREHSQTKQISNVEFVLGDTGDGVRKHLKTNLIVISMVLHHVSSPAEIFNDCQQMLKSGGAVLIVELCRHNQDWVRENCGDLWLGFEPEELTNWAQQAGLENGQSLYLGLRNGFQIQMRLFHLKAA